MKTYHHTFLTCLLFLVASICGQSYAQTSQYVEEKSKAQKAQNQATVTPAGIKRAVAPAKNAEKSGKKTATSVPVRKHAVNPHARKPVVSPTAKQSTDQLIANLENKLAYLKSLPDAPEIRTQIVQIEQQLTKAYEQKSIERECKSAR